MPDPLPSFKMEFVRRRESDGSLRSICLLCHHTIVEVRRRDGLAAPELRQTLECWKKKPGRVDRVEY
jgi:hypothetical protein